MKCFMFNALLKTKQIFRIPLLREANEVKKSIKKRDCPKKSLK